MNNLIIAGLMAIVPNLAFAYSALTCDSESALGQPIKINVSSETGMTDFFSTVRVVAGGQMRVVDLMAQASSQPTLPGQVVLILKSLIPQTTDIDPNGVEAVLTVKTVTISENPLVLQADGIGNLQLTKIPANMTLLGDNFVLSNCKGTL